MGPEPRSSAGHCQLPRVSSQSAADEAGLVPSLPQPLVVLVQSACVSRHWGGTEEDRPVLSAAQRTDFRCGCGFEGFGGCSFGSGVGAGVDFDFGFASAERVRSAPGETPWSSSPGVSSASPVSSSGCGLATVLAGWGTSTFQMAAPSRFWTFRRFGWQLLPNATVSHAVPACVHQTRSDGRVR
mmetsp:Transcript_67736/g.157251  ORF Transcript_67736/g.157251 Transcript_67736/m.157251 type:complete len:184 (+) Transcript_67736:491-1042(+)